ncbi:MAG: hypothetical protein JWP91_2529 [Fibrobacteres bacterium]|nr:hypothetical protein [Fibrobacterota bacterium]
MKTPTIFSEGIRGILLICLPITALMGCLEGNAPQTGPETSIGNDEGSAGDSDYTGSLFGSEIRYKVANGEKLFQGDILLTDKQLEEGGLSKVSGAGCSTLGYRWPNNVVFYNIDPTMPNQARVTQAIAMWEASTPVRFIKVTSSANYITFRWHESKCNSNVGMQGGRQYISCADWGVAGNLAHEIGHALGLFHEQTRASRDNDIEVLYDNVKKEEWAGFDTYGSDFPFNPVCVTGFDSGPFDYNSIMLYSSFNSSIAINSKLPIMWRRSDHYTWVGQRSGLSAGDIAAASFIYTPTWNKYPGTANDIAAGGDGSVWVIGTDYLNGGFSIQKWNGTNGWTKVSGAAVRIAVDSKGIPWVVNSNNNIFKGAKDGLSWTEMPGRATDIGIGQGDAVWVTGTDWGNGGYSIQKWNGTGWTPQVGRGIRISVGPKGPWVINSALSIYEFNGSAWIQRPGSANDIAVAASGQVFIIDNAPIAGGFRVQQWTGLSWVPTFGAGTNIAVSATGKPWISNNVGNIFSW